MPYEVIQAPQNGWLDLLNGALTLGPFPRAGLTVGGKTLVFLEPALTITFPGDEGATVSLLDVLAALRAVPGAQIETRVAQDVPAANARDHFVRLSLCREGGFTLAKTGTANELLGLSTEGETKNAGPLAKNRIVSSGMSGPGAFFAVLAGEQGKRDGS